MNVNVAILVDAKNEYTKQLQKLIVPELYNGFEKIYNDEPNNFQNNLTKIPQWNQEFIEIETDRILKKTECTWIDQLLTAIFVSNVKILTAVKNKKSVPQIELRVPVLSQFIHKCYYEGAREFYKNSYLFDKTLRNSERQINMRSSLKIIEESISEAIRRLLPIRQILNNYLTTSVEEDELSDDDIANKKVKKYKMVEQLESGSDSEEDMVDAGSSDAGSSILSSESDDITGDEYEVPVLTTDELLNLKFDETSNADEQLNSDDYFALDLSDSEKVDDDIVTESVVEPVTEPVAKSVVEPVAVPFSKYKTVSLEDEELNKMDVQDIIDIKKTQKKTDEHFKKKIINNIFKRPKIKKKIFIRHVKKKKEIKSNKPTFFD